MIYLNLTSLCYYTLFKCRNVRQPVGLYYWQLTIIK
jgi:hypothetical protein